jgi:hypothetical protein
MGDVYQASDTKLGRNVAIKFLPEAFSHDTNTLQTAVLQPHPTTNHLCIQTCRKAWFTAQECSLPVLRSRR